MITRRSALQTLAGMAAAPGILRGKRTPGDKPNLLFLWTDQQRADSMAAYGNTRYHVPVWNKLASNVWCSTAAMTRSPSVHRRGPA